MATVTRTTNLPARGNQQSFYDVIDTLEVSGIAQTDLAATLKGVTLSTTDPSATNELVFNTDKRLLQIYRNGAARKVNMFKQPTMILDFEDWGELIRLGGEIDPDKDGTAEFASTDISSAQARSGTYSGDFTSAQELLLPCKDTFNKKSGSLSFWVYSAEVSKTLVENYAGFKLATNSSGYVVFTITESNVTSAAKTVNTVTGSTDITTDAWWHVLITWDNINTGSANGAMHLYINGAEEGTAITSTQIDVAGGEYGNWIIGAGRNDPTWTIDYVMDDIPSNKGWSVTSGAYQSVSNGILTLAPGSNSTNLYRSVAATIFEIKCKFNSLGAAGSFSFAMGDTPATDDSVGIVLSEGYAICSGVAAAAVEFRKYIKLNTKEYHVYRIVKNSTTYTFYIDGVKVYSDTSSASMASELVGVYSSKANASIEYIRYITSGTNAPIANQCGGYVDDVQMSDYVMDSELAKAVYTSGAASESPCDEWQVCKKQYIKNNTKRVVDAYQLQKATTINSATQADITGYTTYVNATDDCMAKITLMGDLKSSAATDVVYLQAAVGGYAAGLLNRVDVAVANEYLPMCFTWIVSLTKGVNDIAVQWKNDGSATATLNQGTLIVEEL